MTSRAQEQYRAQELKPILVVSWRYNIAHEATLETLALEAAKRQKPILFWAPNYATAAGKTFEGNLGDIDRMIIVNTAPLAILSSLKARMRGIPVSFFLHEPIRDLREFLPYYKGLRGLLRLISIKWTNNILCLIASTIVVFSKNGRDKVIPSQRGKVEKSSLRFVDRLVAEEQASRLVSYIGTAAVDHRFDAFVDFVEHCIQSNAFPGHRFGLFTRSKIPDEILQRLAPRTDILQGRTLNQSEMDACYRSTEIVWCCYERTTQSGVLPLCYMFGRPVLGSDRFDPDHFQDGKQGRIPEGFAPVQITAAVAQLLQNIDKHRLCARATFERAFDAEKSDFLK
jgi:hypothetical protein